jgi:hypothetical protein
MLTENDIVEVVINQRHIPTGKPIVNVYHYQARTVVGDWSDPLDWRQLASDVFGTLYAVMSVYQTAEISWDSAVYTNLTNGLDIATYSPPDLTVGAVTGSTEPLYVALSFQLVRASRATRNGSKRIGGIADTFMTDANGSSFVGTAATVAIEEALSQSIPVVVGGGIDCALWPIILRKTALGVPPTVFSNVASAQYRGAGSQTSRKRLL